MAAEAIAASSIYALSSRFSLADVTQTGDEVDMAWHVSTTDGNYFTSTGKDLLLVRNNGGGETYEVTVNIGTDEFGRTGSIVYDLGDNEFAYFGPLGSEWADGDGYVQLDSEDTAIEYIVINLYR